MSAKPLSAIEREILRAGSDDWVPLLDVEMLARRLDPDADPLGAVEAALAALLDDELVELGDVSDGGFFAWEDSPDGALNRLRTEWRKGRSQDDRAFICWVNNTAAGDAAVGNRGSA